MDFPNFQTLFQLARNEALVRNSQLSRDAIERDGSDANIMVAAACAAADEVVGQLTAVNAGLFLDSAAGDALDRLLFDRYGLTRKVASVSVGSVAFSTAAANPAPFTIPSGTKVATANGTTFETIEDTLFPDGTTGPIYVAVRSLLAGASQQAPIGSIVNLISRVVGAPADMTVTNPVATSGASNRESDIDFRNRGRTFFTTVQRGTLSAIRQGALSVPGVIKAQTFEALNASGEGNYRVVCVIADQFTEALADYSVVPPAYDTQSQILAQQVFDVLEEYRPAGVFVNVQLAQTVLVPVDLALSFKPGAAIDSVAVTARAAIVNYINNLNPGESLYREGMLDALRAVPGLNLTGYEIAAPPAGATPTSPLIQTNPLQVLRTSLSLVRAYSSNPGTPIGNYLNVDQVIASR